MIGKKVLRDLDPLLVLLLFLLLAASLFILSTASINVNPADPYYYVKRQALFIGTGLILTALAASVDYQRFAHFSWWIYGIMVLMLVSVFFVGKEANGAARWIPLVGDFNIQPSEFAKILLTISLADFLAKREGKLNRFRDFIPPFLYVLVPTILVFLQPDLGTSLVFIAIFIGMMFIAGANPWKFGGLILGVAAVVAVMLWLHFSTNLPGFLKWAQGMPLPLADYQVNRLLVFINPYADSSGDGYHIIQSLWAIGSGGLWGKGYRMGTQGQLDFLPEHHTDFVFSVVGEEFGFIGTLTLLFLFFMFLVRCINVATKAKDLNGSLIVAGLVSMFIFHILVNIGMTSGIMPVTGIPLPFITYGGSTMWANMLAVGLIFNINLRKKRPLF